MVTAPGDLQCMFIDGKWCKANDGRTLGVINPATEEVLSDVAYGGRAETRQALQAAERAMPGWMKLVWTAGDGQVLVLGGRAAEEFAAGEARWRRREGVEPSGDLTTPRLVLKTSGTTGHLPSPRI